MVTKIWNRPTSKKGTRQMIIAFLMVAISIVVEKWFPELMNEEFLTAMQAVLTGILLYGAHSTYDAVKTSIKSK